jgi:hypothetical protein
MTDAELLEFAHEFREGILDGKPSYSMCFAISAPLACLLDISGVPCTLTKCDNGFNENFYIKLADGRALDPTIDQFNWFFCDTQPPVYLGPPMKYHGILEDVSMIGDQEETK